MTTEAVRKLYVAALKADDDYQTALERQFGRARATVHRYNLLGHNAETQTARFAKIQADKKCRDAIRSCREEHK